MLRLAIFQSEKANRGIGESCVAWRSVAEGSFSNKSSCRHLAHIVKHCGIFVGKFAMNVFGKVIAVYARLRDVIKRRLSLVADIHCARLSKTMMHKYSAGERQHCEADRGCASCPRIPRLCESLTMIGALAFVPAYLCLAFAMAVPFAPGDALRSLLLSLCFMFLGAGVAFLVAADIVRGR